MTTVLAIIVNWRQPDLTIACVHALRQMNHPDLSILVIDNGSGDGSAAQLAAALPHNRHLALPDNKGFAGGYNMGLRLALTENFDYALILNNDAFAAPDMLHCLLAETAADIGLLSPKIFYDNQRDRLWFGGARQDKQLLEIRDRRQDILDGPAYQASKDVEYLLGTCLLVNLDAARLVGLLDETFFLYYEDLDWAIRMRQAGYRLRLVAPAHLYHRAAVSSGGSESPSRRYHLARSSVIFFCRHAHLGQPWAIFLYRLGSASKLLIRLAFSRQWPAAGAYLRGLRDGWQVQEEGRMQKAEGRREKGING